MSNVEPNANIVNLMISEVKAVTNAGARGFDVNNCVTRTELDSHANMVILGKYSYIYLRVLVERVMSNHLVKISVLHLMFLLLMGL